MHVTVLWYLESLFQWCGLLTFTGVVLADVLVFGVVLAVFSVRSHPCLCWLTIDRQVLGTHSVGWCVKAVFTAFTALCDAI